MLSFTSVHVFPKLSSDGPPLLFQRPFLRLFFGQGPAWVAVFFILSGYVNALKPMRMLHDAHVAQNTTGAEREGVLRSLSRPAEGTAG